MRYKKQLELNELYLKGATKAAFTAYAEAGKAYENGAAAASPAEKRLAIAALARKHLRLPAAERTYITAVGTGPSHPEDDSVVTANGKLTIGYGANERSIGLEYAAVVNWFQGGHDQGNPEYAAQLAELLKDLRKTVEKPDLPVVCVTAGGMFFKGGSDDHPVNKGLRRVAAMPEFKGRVDVMDAYHWRASEVGVIGGLIHKRKIKPDPEIQERLRSAGAGSFYLLAGQEAGARLAQLISE